MFFLFFGGFWVWAVSEVFEEGLDDGLAVGDFGSGCQGAVGWVGYDLFYEGGFFGAVGACGRGFAGQVQAGDLQAVEEEAGALGVDLVGGDAAEDFADGELDGGAVFGEREVEVRLAGSAGGWVFYRAARGVVVVAELLVAEAWAAAAAAVGEDVAALVAFGFGVHVCIPPGYLLVLKSSNKMG